MRAGKPTGTAPSRRDFLKTSAVGAAAGIALERAIAARSYAGEDNTIKVALVGCGGRGTGAAVNALSTVSQGPVKLVAMADVFKDRLEGSLGQLNQQFKDQIDVPPDRQFLGFDAHLKAMDVVGPGGLVLLATPPAFRPVHVEHAVAKGCHVFMEKSFGVDVPGALRIRKAGEEATKKNLKIAGGLMSRHSKALMGAVEQIHNGAIGDVIACWAYRMHAPVGFGPIQSGQSELEHQIRNYSNFTWLNGTFILDWLIHNLDVCCWVKGAWPESAQGMGGRQVRTEPDQLFDHESVEYTFPDGTKLLAQGRHMDNCWGFFGDFIQGTKGSAILGEGIPDPKLYKGYKPTTENVIWQHKGGPSNAYQYEHDLLFEAIRQDKPYNEADRCVNAALTGIMGRMAAEGGKKITWDELLASKLELAPGLDNMTASSEPPVKPENGKYPVAMPGITVVL